MSKFANFQRSIGFKLTPIGVELDDGQAFADFVRFATGKNVESMSWLLDYQHICGDMNFAKTKEGVAGYIDWLIKNMWGKDAITLQALPVVEGA
jgi:hypothetical protein